jgi:hypothetical protein
MGRNLASISMKCEPLLLHQTRWNNFMYSLHSDIVVASPDNNIRTNGVYRKELFHLGRRFFYKGIFIESRLLEVTTLLKTKN